MPWNKGERNHANEVFLLHIKKHDMVDNVLPQSTVLQPYLLRKTKQKAKVLLLSLFVVAFRPSLRLPLSIVSYFLCYTTVLREILPSSDSGKTTSAKCQLSNSASLLAHVFPRFATAASNLIGSFDRLIQFWLDNEITFWKCVILPKQRL